MRVAMNDGNDRLEIGVSNGQVDLIQVLATHLEPPFSLLYVLMVPRTGQEEGRYQLSPLLESEELSTFFDRYRTVFEQDGRHAVWVQSQSDRRVSRVALTTRFRGEAVHNSGSSRSSLSQTIRSRDSRPAVPLLVDALSAP